MRQLAAAPPEIASFRLTATRHPRGWGFAKRVTRGPKAGIGALACTAALLVDRESVVD